jgi:hypothetical protein
MTRTLRKLAVAFGLGTFPVIALAGAAGAQVGPPAPSTTSTTAGSTTTTTAAPGSGSSLPFTGNSTGPLVVLGVAALGGGYAVVHARRRVDGPQV